MDRREYLKAAGAGTVAISGSLLVIEGTGLITPDDTLEKWGPPGDGWRLEFRDHFQDGSLDPNKWGVGWGWGWQTGTSPTQISPSNVVVENDTLRLRGTHDGDEIHSGAINTKNTATITPDSYVEARIKFARRTGFLNAFWAKPVSEVWPPEIDVVELFQSGEDPEATSRTYHHIHYSTSGEPGDESTYTSVDDTGIPGGDLTESFHVYGFEWRDDRIVHYVDDEPVAQWTDETILSALDIDIPFYLMLSLNIGNYGQPDRSEQWGEEMVVDWVRLWERED